MSKKTVPFHSVANSPSGVVVVGIVGPQGPSGGARHSQTFTSVSSIPINHNLGFEPDVTVMLASGEVVEADVIHGSLNQFTVGFSSPQSGKVLWSG